MLGFDCALTRPDFTFDARFETSGGLTALFGRSGSGKSTAIRLLAGLERASRGRITLDDTVMLDTATGHCLPPHKRRMGLVFQDAQLFPHLSVAANLAYGRWFTPRSGRAIAREPVVEALGIGHLLGRMPATLSGGERQRVAIGRAVLSAPRLLLMDEPLAALDTQRRLEILPLIERLRDEFSLPIVYVSHAVEEVARLARQVVHLDQGRVRATGTPSEVLAGATRSGSRFEALSILTGSFDTHLADFGVTLLRHPAGQIVIPGRIDPGAARVQAIVRATNVTLAIGRPSNISVRTALSGTITEIDTDDGPFALATIRLVGGDILQAYATRLAIAKLGLDAGDEVTALVKAVAIDERGVPGLKVVS